MILIESTILFTHKFNLTQTHNSNQNEKTFLVLNPKIKYNISKPNILYFILININIYILLYFQIPALFLYK